MSKESIFVVGHKNPDTDSICSAIAYASLRRRQGMENVEPARAGNINRQTEFVLDELGLERPRLLVDVHPRVRDVVGKAVVTVDGDAPLAHAMELFHRHNIRLVPVIDAERNPLGLIYLKKLSERFLIPSCEEDIGRVQASLESIRTCLNATALNMVEGGEVEELKLFVGAMASATFNKKMVGRDPRRMILVTGDRENIQLKAVEMGVRLLIVTGSLPVSARVLKIAKEEGTTILSTAFDTSTSAWLTRLSTPVRCLVGDEFMSVGMNERLDDLRVKMLHGKDPGVLVLDGAGKVEAVATKSHLLIPSPVKLILVDHNELAQSVDGAEKVEIIEVIDHHRLGNFHSDQPIRFINQPLGSTCTLVATLYRQAGIDPGPEVAALMLAGLLSDTVILKSPTTTEVDREMATWLGNLSGRDPLEFGRSIFGAGSSLGAYPSVADLILADFKEYRSGDQGFGMGQVEVVSFHEFHSMKKEIVEGLAAIKEERRLGTAGLLVTDIVQETSLLLALGSAELPYIIDYPQIEKNLYELKGVLSRKKQLVPHLLKVLKG